MKISRLLCAMGKELLLPTPESGSKKPSAVRPWFLTAVLGIAALIGWLAWPSEPDIGPFELSRADGRSRFYATTYSKMEMPRNLPLSQRLWWAWAKYKQEYRRRYSKPNPAAYSFPAGRLRLSSIEEGLNLCMAVTGTRYLIAVEIVGQGALEFLSTNALNGAQWVAAFENDIQSVPTGCYDYATKRVFHDTLLLIRERPGVVKVVPRKKLAEYQKIGLVKAGSQ